MFGDQGANEAGIQGKTGSIASGGFPHVRLHRVRAKRWCRTMLAENDLRPHDLILPLFLRGEGISPEINSLPGVTRYLVEDLDTICQEVIELGLSAVCLFPVIPFDLRSENAQEILNPEGLLLKGIRFIKQRYPDLGVITDVALDAFTDHGHDGLIRDGKILNDETLHLMAQAAILHAQAGTDIIAPSDMMDGRVSCIREALDRSGFSHVPILSYTAKYASAFYQPFREALGADICLGTSDKKSYQMDPANGQEALREAFLDIQEGADMLLVKPGSLYLDIIYRIKKAFGMPTLAYHVSGEYAMLQAAAQKGWLKYELALMEVLLSLKRAGADAIITNGALDAAHILKKMHN